ncbi:hypothetical protein GQ457_05G010090 [Hibiscus cannabinus]
MGFDQIQDFDSQWSPSRWYRINFFVEEKSSVGFHLSLEICQASTPSSQAFVIGVLKNLTFLMKLKRILSKEM